MVEAVKEIEEIQSYKTQSEAIEADKKSAPLARRVAWKGLVWGFVGTCCSLFILTLFIFFTPKTFSDWISDNFFSIVTPGFFIAFFVSLIIWLGSFVNGNGSSSCYNDEDDYIGNHVRSHDSSHNSDYHRDIITNPAYSSLSSNVHHRH